MVPSVNHKAFDLFDTDGSGEIDSKELKAADLMVEPEVDVHK